MQKTYKYRIYPTKKQENKLNETLEQCRILYNSALVDRNRHYEQIGKGLSYKQQASVLILDKKKMPILNEIHSQVLQEVLKRVDRAYKNFFRRFKGKEGKAGYPRFKNADRYHSITYPQSGFEIIDGKLKLSKIGHIKIKQHRQINGIIKTCNIKKEIGKWYVCLSVEYNKDIQKQMVIHKHIGIDAGIKSFISLSDGKLIDNPKHLVKSEEKLIKVQKRLSNKKKGSNNRRKAKELFAKLHKKIFNQRKDFQHKLSRELVNNYDAIGVEDLRIKNMVKNHNLAKSILEVGWGQFLSYIDYKAEEAGKLYIKVDARNTSKECHICGHVYSDMTLDVRQWGCPGCRTIHNRDINAACVIDKRMLKKIRQELPEYRLVETGSMDDIADSNICVLKSISPEKQEASSVSAR